MADTSGQRWPEDGSPASFDEIVSPLRALVEQAYALERKPLHDLDYQGLDRGSKHILSGVKDALSAERLRYDDEEQGRDALDVILGLAVQLGIEQGRRTLGQDLKLPLELLEGWISGLELSPTDRFQLDSALEGLRRYLPQDGSPR